MDGSVLVEAQVQRGARGRFSPGVSGNPAGKQPGTRNRVTVLAEVLAADESGAVARIVIDKALAGDAVAARFLLGLMVPKPRSRAIELDLPPCDSLDGVAESFTVTVAAMAAGEITPDEALTVSKVLDRRRGAIEARAAVASEPDDVVAAMAAGEITPAEALAASPLPARRKRAGAAADLHSTCKSTAPGDVVTAVADGSADAAAATPECAATCISPVSTGGSHRPRHPHPVTHPSRHPDESRDPSCRYPAGGRMDPDFRRDDEERRDDGGRAR